ncbi:MAG: hypothetical protein ACTH31_07730, partial [Pseudoclavibacter sp.]
FTVAGEVRVETAEGSQRLWGYPGEYELTADGVPAGTSAEPISVTVGAVVGPPWDLHPSLDAVPTNG